MQFKPLLYTILRMNDASFTQKPCLFFKTTKCRCYGVEDAIKFLRSALQDGLCHTLSWPWPDWDQTTSIFGGAVAAWIYVLDVMPDHATTSKAQTN